jgi:hypothetical protein
MLGRGGSKHKTQLARQNGFFVCLIMPNASPLRYSFDLQSITPNGGNYYVLVMGRNVLKKGAMLAKRAQCGAQ